MKMLSASDAIKLTEEFLQRKRIKKFQSIVKLIECAAKKGLNSIDIQKDMSQDDVEELKEFFQTFDYTVMTYESSICICWGIG